MIFLPPGPLNNFKITRSLLLIFILSFLLVSCSSSGKFTSREEIKIEESGAMPIRVLLTESDDSYTYIVKNQIGISDGSKKIAMVQTGNSLQFIPDGTGLKLKIGDKLFRSEYFLLQNEDNTAFTKFNGNSYTGIVKVVSSGNKINVINTLGLEEYLKGVLPLEMPVGKGQPYFESYKAFAVCARTYAVMKMKEGKSLFDIYADTRDQVFGGSEKGNKLSDLAVDETRGMILTYDDEPAVIYYHSTCGGRTEDVKNVFSKKEIPYLRGIKDGDKPNCFESPRFSWEESYTPRTFVSRLRAAKLIPDLNYELVKIHIASRFESGRINELQILLNDSKNNPKMISIYGNGIRSIIRNSDNSSILRSTQCEISFAGSTVNIKGNGFGHGVGLCQWGAMYLSSQGNDYKEILQHYYPGTIISRSDD